MPTARTSFAAAPLGTSLYAISGSRFSANTPYTHVVEVYDTTARTWSQVTSSPSGRYGHAAVALGGRLYVLGGGVKPAMPTPRSSTSTHLEERAAELRSLT